LPIDYRALTIKNFKSLRDVRVELGKLNVVVGPNGSGKSSLLEALLFLSRVLGACTNKPVFVVDRGPWYSWAFQELGLEYYHETFGDRSRVERFFGSLKRRTRVFFNNINARRSRIASLDRMMNIFFVYYNGPRFQEGIGRVPSEVIAVVG
jgi:recombinational DNA repair ATPase RecF